MVTISGMHLNPWRILLFAIAGWMNRERAVVIEYLKEENRILRELHGKPLLLAVLGSTMMRKLLSRPLDRNRG